MCGAVSSIFKAVTFGVLGKLLLDEQKAPEMPAPPPTPERPQAAQAPDEQARRASQRASGATGPATAAPAGTMLTGAGGITNDLLNLGKNTLLGQ